MFILFARNLCTDNGIMIANFALRNFHKAVPFPQSLELDAGGCGFS